MERVGACVKESVSCITNWGEKLHVRNQTVATQVLEKNIRSCMSKVIPYAVYQYQINLWIPGRGHTEMQKSH